MSLAALPVPFDAVLSSSTLDNDAASVCVLDADGRIVWVNRTWERFAAENGGDKTLGAPAILGLRWLDAIRGTSTHHFFSTILARVCTEYSPGQTVNVRGKCNSPTLTRDIVTQLAPIIDLDSRRTIGVLVRYDVLATVSVDKRYTVHKREDQRYRGADGQLLQCCSCRRVRVVGENDVWEFVPEYVERSDPAVSHGICAPCIELLYGWPFAEDVRASADAR